MKKLLSLALAALLLNLCAAPHTCAAANDRKRGEASAAEAARKQAADDAKAVEKIRKKVADVGTKKREFVQVNVRGGGRKYGYIAEIGEDRFTLIDSKTGAPTEFAYAEVGGVRRTRLTSKSITVLGFVSAAVLGLLVVGTIYGASRGQ